MQVAVNSHKKLLKHYIRHNFCKNCDGINKYRIIN